MGDPADPRPAADRRGGPPDAQRRALAAAGAAVHLPQTELTVDRLDARGSRAARRRRPPWLGSPPALQHARDLTPPRPLRGGYLACSTSSSFALERARRGGLYCAAVMTRLFDPADPRPIHFVGIAGAGMSALAELFALRGVSVTGCDAHPENAADLGRLGASPSRPATRPLTSTAARALVVTSAMPKDHPELARARELGLPVVRRAEALGEATAGGDARSAIAGTHGKSTTTVMTTEALAAGGLDPTGVRRRARHELGRQPPPRQHRAVRRRGGRVRSLVPRALAHDGGGHERRGGPPRHLRRPRRSPPHLRAVRRARARYVVLCADDAGANALPTPRERGGDPLRASTRPTRGSAPPSCGARARHRLHRRVRRRDRWARSSSPCPGEHNVLQRARRHRRGARARSRGRRRWRPGSRRFAASSAASSCSASIDGALVVDDYAHHPTEVRATIEAARSAAPERRLVVAFQPHLFSRTRDFAREFGEALVARRRGVSRRHLSGARAADARRDERSDRRRRWRRRARARLARRASALAAALAACTSRWRPRRDHGRRRRHARRARAVRRARRGAPMTRREAHAARPLFDVARALALRSPAIGAVAARVAPSVGTARCCGSSRSSACGASRSSAPATLAPSELLDRLRVDTTRSVWDPSRAARGARRARTRRWRA